MNDKDQRPPTRRRGMASATNVTGSLLGHEVSTKRAVPTSARPIGSHVSALLEPLHARKRGKRFVPPDLLAAWPDLVGPRLAGLCMPVNMKTQPKARSRHRAKNQDGALLEVLCDPRITVDIDYGQALIVERINAFFGYQAVARLKVVAKAQSDTQPAPDTDRTTQPATPGPDDLSEAERTTGRVENESLRSALTDLGSRILADARKR